MAEAAGVPAAVPARLLAGDRLGTMLTDGDTAAARAVAAAADALADALLPAQLLLDPAGIVLGGRLGGLGEPLRGRLAKRMHEAGARRVPIRLGTLGPDAALRGAAGSVVDRVIADPTPWLPG
jgi:predicted NBD/HSP70 family sugar kinase